MDFNKILKGVQLILEGAGEDLSREGIVDTPNRVARAWESFTQYQGPSDDHLLDATFSVEHYQDFVIITGIDFSSLCEHHLLPFFGKVSIAYIPNGTDVVGISKLARIVDKYSRRLQLQERMTQEILSALKDHMEQQGILVIVRAQHMCMTTRGVMKPGSWTITRAMSGQFQNRHDLVIEAQQLLLPRL